jgi:hypothetical protein
MDQTMEKILMKRNNTKNYKKAVAIYELKGVSGVYDAVQSGELTHDYFRYCTPCEAQTPIEDQACLICGSGVYE